MFGSFPAQHVTIDDLHNKILARLKLRTVPAPHVEATHQRKKTNKELMSKFHNVSTRKITDAVCEVLSDVDPAILLGLPLKNAKKLS